VSITSTIVDQAEIRFREAVEALKPYVGCFWTITAGRHAAIRVVPDGSTSISAQQQDGRWTGWSLRGPLVRPDERRFTSPATLVGIRLRPGVAYILSGIAAHQTVGRRLELQEIAPFRELLRQAHLTSNPVRFAGATARRLASDCVSDFSKTRCDDTL
jgi:hypothetical protein